MAESVQEKGGKRVRIEDVVYCLTHTEVHEDTLDPYGVDVDDCYGGEFGLRKQDVHRPVYWTARKGDWA